MTETPPTTPVKSPFLRLKKRLWIGTLVINAILLPGAGLYRPDTLPIVATSIILGHFYLWSLLYNAQNPRRGVQALFSLIRMVALAWMVARLSHGRAFELALVMGGLLSYKMVLIVEYAIQAAPAFRRSGKTSPAQ